MKTYQSIQTLVRKLGWIVEFNKEKMQVHIITPAAEVRVNVAGPMVVKKLKTDTKRWVKADANQFFNYVRQMYGQKYPKRNIKKSNAARKRINERQHQVPAV